MRMLMVSPASWSDIVLSKLLVALVYQLLVSSAVLIIQGGFTGQVPLLLLFTLLSACFGLCWVCSLVAFARRMEHLVRLWG